MMKRDAAWPPGTPCWVDVSVPDLNQATPFYAGLFGWQLDRARFMLDGRPVAGIGGDELPGWTTYLAVTDVDAAAAAIVAAGGRIRPPRVVPGVGRKVIAMDDVGAPFAVWEAGEQIGAAVVNEPGALVWNELMSGDLVVAKRFYASVFGYTYGDVADLPDPYAMFKVDDAVVGGLGVTDATPHWQTYFEVASTDDASAKVVELGGTVLRPAENTPYGRIAAVADNQGIGFSLVQG